MRLGMVLGGVAKGYTDMQDELRKEQEFADAQDLRNRQLAARKAVAALPPLNSTTTAPDGTSDTFSNEYGRRGGDPNDPNMPTTADAQTAWLASHPYNPSTDPNRTWGVSAPGAPPTPLPASAIQPVAPTPAPVATPAPAAAPAPTAAPARALVAGTPVTETPATKAATALALSAGAASGGMGVNLPSDAAAAGAPSTGGAATALPVPPTTAAQQATAPGAAVQTAQAAQAGQVIARDRSPLAENIRAMAANEKLPSSMAETAVAIAGMESNMNATVRPNGSSTGLFQFHPDTFAQYGGKDIHDVNQQIGAEFNLIRDANAKLTPILGRPPTAAEIYLYHQQGSGGGKALLKADPSASAISVLGRFYKTPAQATNAIRNNWPTGPKNAPTDPTVGQFLGAWDSRTSRFLATPLGAPSGQRPTQAAAEMTPEEAAQAKENGWTATSADPNDNGVQAHGTPSPGAQFPEHITPTETDPAKAPYVSYQDENGNMRVTQQPHQITSDDLDQRTIDIYRQHGLVDQVASLEANLQARQKGELELHTARQTAADNDYDEAVTQAQRLYATNPQAGLDAMEKAANGRATGVMSQAHDNGDGTVTVAHYDNRTGQLSAIDDPVKTSDLFEQLHSFKNGETALALQREFRANAVENVKASAAMKQAQTAQDELDAKTKAGVFTSAAAAATAQAAASNAQAGLNGEQQRALAANRTQLQGLDDQINAINTQLQDPNTPYNTKLQLQVTIGRLQSQASNMRGVPGAVTGAITAINNGQDSVRTGPNGQMEIWDQTLGDFVPPAIHAQAKALLSKGDAAQLSNGTIVPFRDPVSGAFALHVPGYVDARGQEGSFTSLADAQAAARQVKQRKPGAIRFPQSRFDEGPFGPGGPSGQ